MVVFISLFLMTEVAGASLTLLGAVVKAVDDVRGHSTDSLIHKDHVDVVTDSLIHFVVIEK